MNGRRTLAHIVGVLALVPVLASAQKFFPDDPIKQEPPPVQTRDVNLRELNDLWSMFENLFGKPGERHPERGVIPSMGANTMGEVLDGPWFVNRHQRKRMTTEQLTAGPRTDDPPSEKQPWRVLTVKRYDVRPGLMIADADNTLYLLRFDPPGRLEMSTGASMVASAAYHALGYWVPENYIVYFSRAQLAASPEGEDINAVGEAKKLLEEDIDLFLERVAADKQRGYRAVATKVPKGKPLGPYSFYGLRSDDPNDIYPHEHRREQRAPRVFSAWLGNNWIRPLATFDFLVEENGVSFIRHYIVDFFSSLGSGFETVKHPREGHEPWFDWDEAVINFVGLGFRAPKWERARYPGIRSVGRFEYETFEPEDWMPNTHLASLANHLPDDDLWAARAVMAFTDDDIRALVKAGQYSDPRAEQWLAKCLIERRNKIGQTYFSKVLPLDQTRIEEGELRFECLGARYGFVPAPEYRVVWTEFANFSQQHTPMPGETSLRVPREALEAEAGTYYAARISTGEYGKTTDVFVRKEATGVRVVGVDFHWPGKLVADRQQQDSRFASRYEDFEGRRKELFDLFTQQYNDQTGFKLGPEEYFDSLSVSERTTFDAVTHALMKTELTDEGGNSLGTALDLVAEIDHIAGQYYGRQGDEQFRIYAHLRPGARDTIEKCPQFFRDHGNTVYHMGYPLSFRQTGKEPTLQVSMAEDGSRADIDVDYRSSKMPAAMWNGHLTSANSDVRAGDNYDRHSNRWSGLVAWWKRIFGEFAEQEAPEATDLWETAPPLAKVTPLPPNRPLGAPIEDVGDAVQEFLADWLVRKNFDEAMDFVSDEALPCLVLSPGSNVTKGTRKAMRKVLEESSGRLGRPDSLSVIIESVQPWGPNIRKLDHRFAAEFDLVEASDSLGETFLCRNRAGRFKPGATTSEPTFGTYYGAIFRFRIPTLNQGALALLWKKEEDGRALVRYPDPVA